MHRRFEVSSTLRAVGKDVNNGLNNLIVVIRVVMTHVVAIDKINCSVLTSCDRHVRVSAWLIGKENYAA